jgi:hypothetical protein
MSLETTPNFVPFSLMYNDNVNNTADVRTVDFGTTITPHNLGS